MEHQHHGTQQEKPLILRYDKRRYDGGVEIELIEYLEEQRALQLAEAKAQQAEEATVPVVEPQPHSRSQKIWGALLVGPMEMAVGAVGILTTTLAIFTFIQVKNTELADQSKAVFKECLKTFFQGIGHSLVAPGKALKIAMVGT